MSGPLSGVRVLELVRVAPGAFCTMMLADMGADVIKLEYPSGVVSSISPREDKIIQQATSFFNRNKKSVMLNLKEPEGQKILQQLAATADVFVEGFRPGVMKRLGGDYDTLSRLNPRLVYCSLTGYGQDGPYRDLVGHDINYLSLAGVLNLLGEPDGMPAIPSNLVADYAGASMHGVVGILLALLARERTGQGQLVDISYLDTTISLLSATPQMRDYFAEGIIPARGKGLFSGRYAFYGVYETQDDKLLSIGCTEPWLWNNFCDAIDRPDLKALAMKGKDYSQFAGEDHRQGREDLARMFKTKTRDEWFDMLTKHEVCVGKVYDAPEVFEDPQVRHRKMAVDLEHPKAGKVTQPGVAIKLSDTPGEIRSFAPYLGQHNDEILQELGYNAQQIAELKEKKVISQ